MQTVDGVSDDRYCRVEAERKVSAADIVVDRLGNGDERKLMLLPKVARGRERAFAPDNDQSIQTVCLEILFEPCETLFVFERIEARRAEDRAAARQNTVDGRARQRLDVTFKQAEIAVSYPQYLNAVRQRASHDGANCGI